MARHSGLDWLLTEKSLDPIVRPLTLGDRPTLRGILHPLEAAGTESAPARAGTAQIAHPAVSADAPCLLQHSSGTTGLQKAVMLSHRAVRATRWPRPRLR
jgi:acyl-CoA synthetase (AMP-forming)/AMP-acid ligase II